MNQSISAKEKLEMQQYKQRLFVNWKRQELYEQNFSSSTNEQVIELQVAEAALREIEENLAKATEEDEKSGRLFDTRDARTKSDLLGPDTTGLEAQVYLRMEQIPTSIYHLFDRARNPLISVTVRNTGKDKTKPIRRVRVTSFIDGFSAPDITSLELQPQKTYTFDQLPTLLPERVKSITELTRTSLNIMIEDLDTQKVELHNTYPVWMLARTTAPLSVRDPKTGKMQDFTPYLGCYITPNAPAVMTFLRSAAEQHPEKVLMGYQGDLGQVMPQVKAIYEALQNAGICYVNSVIGFTPELGMVQQRIRLPRESLEDRQANCIDGTVLFASLLEAISMSPAIVLVPGHAFLAWESWSDQAEDWHYLETTMIGDKPFVDACAYAEHNARLWRQAAASNPNAFRLLPLRELRVRLKIFPME